MSSLLPHPGARRAGDTTLMTAILKGDLPGIEKTAGALSDTDPATVLTASRKGMENTQPFSAVWRASREFGMAIVQNDLLLRRVPVQEACAAMAVYLKSATPVEKGILSAAFVETLARPKAREDAGIHEWMNYAVRIVDIMHGRPLANQAGMLMLDAIGDPSAELSRAQRFERATYLGKHLYGEARQRALEQVVFLARTDPDAEIGGEDKVNGLVGARLQLDSAKSLERANATLRLVRDRHGDSAAPAPSGQGATIIPFGPRHIVSPNRFTPGH